MELTLFVIIGVIAVVSAAMMLISENAVYSALFLILNFACIAFFFLMLNAPFLAMVQITVYAGAIMVLFLFVIMLLGAERVEHFSPSRFRWLSPVAILLALVFLVTASVAIIGGEIEFTEQQESVPEVRVINAYDERDADGDDAIDVYLNGDLVAAGVDFADHSRYEQWQAGLYDVTIFTAGADPASDDPLVTQPVEINAGEAISLVAIGRAMGAPGAGLAVATHDIDYQTDKDGLWLAAVNALPDWSTIDVIDEDGDDVLIGNLAYGKAAEIELDKGTYDIGLYPTGSANRLAQITDAEFEPSDSILLVFTEKWLEGNAFEDRIIKLEAKGQSTFGGPTHVGRLLFSRYVLPFEMVSLLLLVAMIGAIVLTHETLGQRRRVVRRLANPPAGLDQPITGEANK